jgi:hypothetical protein
MGEILLAHGLLRFEEEMSFNITPSDIHTVTQMSFSLRTRLGLNTYFGSAKAGEKAHSLDIMIKRRFDLRLPK